MSLPFALVAGFILAVIAIGFTHLMFASDARRGLNASQWLLAGLIWFVMMLILYIIQRTPFAIRL